MSRDTSDDTFRYVEMPKRQKQSKELPCEGRPAALNLGDFLALQIESKQSASPATVQSEQFPALPTVTTTTSTTTTAIKTTGQTWVRPSPSTSTSVDSPAPSSEPEQSKSGLPYNITKTKKGSIPIRVESRNKGKKVTVVFNVTGDSRELLKELKHSAGCGGVVREDTIELQGEKISVVEKIIKSKMGWR